MLRIGEILFRFRDYTPIPFILAMVYFAQADQQSLLLGSLAMVVGELIRIYGVAYIGGVSRTRSHSTGQKVITGGPFARVRNPLYLGNLLLSSGLIIASNLGLWFVGLFVAFFFLQYIPMVLWEESNLKKVFGQDFEDYLKQVPRWIPRLIPAHSQDPEIKGDYASAVKSEKNTLLAAVVLYLLILWRSGFFQGLGA